MERNAADFPSFFIRFCNEIDEIYHLYAKKHNLPNMAFWILYALYENDASYTQKQLCDEWHCTPQTVNSALKNLEKQGIITLKSSEENQKNKWISLTDSGKEMAQQVISPLVLAEQQTLQQFAEKERTALLSLAEKYIQLLQSQVKEI